MSIFSVFTSNRMANLVDLQEMETRAAIQASRLRRLGGEGALRREVARLDMIVEALMRAIIRGGVITADEFARVIREVDAEDGAVDGRRKAQSRPRTLPGRPPKGP